MQSSDEIIEKLKNKRQIAFFCKKNGISYLALFGSFARGEENKKSDVDLLVDFSQNKSLFDFVDVKIKLEKILGRKVDLVSKNYIKPLLKPYINKDALLLYEKR